PRAIVVWRDQPSRCRQYAETAEVISRDVLATDDRGLVIDGQVEITCALVSEDRREHGRIALEKLERRVRKYPADPSAVCIVVIDVVPVRAVHLPLVRVPRQRDERLRFEYWQRPHQHGIHEAEDRGVGADAERE